MINLDSQDEIKKIDKGGILSSIERLPYQISQAWEEVNKLNIPQECLLSKNVVISGMGGSALGGRIIDSLIPDRVRTPIEVFTEFHLPNYVNKETLVVLSSYSGNTQETLSAGHEAIKRGATIFCVTTGGKLKEFANENSLPSYIFEPKENPSNQPRMGLGYSIASILAILTKCEFITIGSDEIRGVIELLNNFLKEYGVTCSQNSNLAKLTAKKLLKRIPILIASEHLVGSVHSFKNQLNENSKTFSALFDIPEANHHLMEGLRNPAQAKEFLHLLFFESALYSSDVKIRYPITREVVEKNEIETSVYTLRSDKKLLQIFETLIFGSYVSFYLAMLYAVDPAPIPWVDYFKEKIAR